MTGAPPPRLRRIFPAPADLTVDSYAKELLARRAERRPPADRPWLSLNFVASVDGRASLEGRSAGLSGPADRALFHALRATVDAVMFGAGTANVERYGRMIKDPGRRAWRARSGLAAEPLAVCASGDLNVSADLPLLDEPEARLVIGTRVARRLEDSTARVEYFRLLDNSLAPLMRSLRTDHGVEHALCEGGPKLGAALLSEDLVDEIHLTVSPLLVGGPAFPIVGGELNRPIALDLVDSIESGGAVFQRYAVDR